MKKILKIILGIIILVVVYWFFKNSNLNKPNNELVMHQLLQEEYMNSDTFTISPDDNWIVYSNGQYGKENLMAINTTSLEKYNLTENTNLGSILVGQLYPSQDCWSIDSKHCTINAMDIGFSTSEPKLISPTSISNNIVITPHTFGTCSDCNKTVEEYNEKSSSGNNCGGFTHDSPDGRYKAKLYSCDLSNNRYVYLIDNITGLQTTVTNQGSKFHWTSDSKKLYFTQPKNVISYIEVE